MGILDKIKNLMNKKKQRNATLIVVGLDNAGKSTLISSIQGEIPEFATPTWGFKSDQVKHNNFNLTVFDQGGGEGIRGIWSRYYAEVYGAIYVVDASDAKRFEESKATLHKAATHENIRGKPLLIFANKQDLPSALSAPQIAQEFELEKLGDSPYHICSCVALAKPKEKFDPNIKKGLTWLVDTIAANYDALRERVAKETEIQQALEKRELEEKKARVAKAREERLRLEREQEEASAAAAAQQTQAAQSSNTASESKPHVEGDPNVNTTTTKTTTEAVTAGVNGDGPIST